MDHDECLAMFEAMNKTVQLLGKSLERLHEEQQRQNRRIDAIEREIRIMKARNGRGGW